MNGKNKRSAQVWRNCAFCLLAFRTFRSKVAQGRGVYCSKQCHGRAMVIKPVRASLIESTINYRNKIRALVKAQGLNKRVVKFADTRHAA